MRIRQAGALLAFVFILSGCAGPPQLPVSLAGDYFTASKPGRVGVVMTELPKPDTEFPGAGCLLCLATASLANSTLTTHVRTLNADDIKPLKADLAKLLRARGLEPVVIEEPIKIADFPDRGAKDPNQAQRDFSALKEKYKIDRLLVVQLNVVGVWRNYSAYIPTGDPRAVIKGLGYLVNLNSHALEWYEVIDVSRAADGKWDEPPKFPGITNAYFQAIEHGMDTVKKPFTGK